MASADRRAANDSERARVANARDSRNAGDERPVQPAARSDAACVHSPAANSYESKGDGETWEAYAHRLEGRIKQQRDHIKNLVELREPGDIHARKRIAYLERILGRKEVQLAQQHEGLHALKERLADGVPTWREILLGISDGTIEDPCWCGEDWWEAHDAHADEREHAEWCLNARDAVGIAR